MTERRAFMAVVATVALVIAAVDAQPAPPGCTNALASLAPCIKYITGGVEPKNPSQACCSALAPVVKTDASCLCQVLVSNNAGAVNQSQVLELPRACNVSSPQISRCAGPTPKTSDGSTIFGASMTMSILLMGIIVIKNLQAN